MQAKVTSWMEKSLKGIFVCYFLKQAKCKNESMVKTQNLLWNSLKNNVVHHDKEETLHLLLI